MRDTLLTALIGVQIPYLNQDIVDAKVLADYQLLGQVHHLRFELPFPLAQEDLIQLQQACEHALRPIVGESLALEFSVVIPRPAPKRGKDSVAGVKQIVAISSGKGGVGKSTSAVNLALALKALGLRVGLLDADIYGPSIGKMLGVAEGQRPGVEEERWFVPIEAHGVFSMSIGYLVNEEQAMVWRGPKVSGALLQLATQTRWPDLDVLLVDMPPGTGDIQLTFAQKIPATGSVVVTTPQDIALLDAKKGIEMFRKTGVPVLGVLENMALHRCSHCGQLEHVFGEGGGQRIAERYQTQLLASMPLDAGICKDADQGRPSVVAAPEGDISRLYQTAAIRMMAALAIESQQHSQIPVMTVVD